MRRDKREDRHLRIIYTRVLERTLSKVVSFFQNNETADKKKFSNLLKELQKRYDKATPVPLDSDYYSSLEKLVLTILNLVNKEFDIDEVGMDIVREANRLKKSKRVRKLKREKHRKREFEDGN